MFIEHAALFVVKFSIYRYEKGFMYFMKHKTPSYRTFGYFIHDVLQPSVEELFYDLNRKIFAEEHVDLNHLYIDGSKFEANANKYQWA